MKAFVRVSYINENLYSYIVYEICVIVLPENE